MVRSGARSANLADLRKVLLQEVLEAIQVSWANMTRRNVVVMRLPAKTEYARMHL